MTETPPTLRADALLETAIYGTDIDALERTGRSAMTAMSRYFPFIFAHESRSVTVRLKTSAPGLESTTSPMKYAVRSN